VGNQAAPGKNLGVPMRLKATQATHGLRLWSEIGDLIVQFLLVN
jgi:hypothetical protein